MLDKNGNPKNRNYKNEEYKYIIHNILQNAKDFEVFRGIELTKKQVKKLNEDIEINIYINKR